MNNPLSFKGKKILITGSTSGIGRSLLNHICAFGGEVVALGRNREKLDEISQISGVEAAVSLDFTDLKNLDSNLKNLILNYGPFHGVFHSAGNELVRPIKILKPDDTIGLLEISVVAAIQIAKAFSSRKNNMQLGQSIVFMSSVAGSVGKAGLAAYSASKSAVDGATKSLACELSGKDIRVNSIAAGAIQTEMHQRITKDLDEDSINEYEAQHLLGFGEPKDVAMAACFLLSDMSRWVTGTTLYIDGGYTCH